MPEIAVPDVDGLLLDQLDLTQPAQTNRSGWTGKRKTVGLPGIELWNGKATIDSLPTEIAERPWRAFLYQIGDLTNWFKWTLPCNQHTGAKPVVAAGASDGYTLPLSGMAPGVTLLKAGQYITVPLPSGYARAVCLVADLVSNGAGTGTATFKPALSEVPATGAEVETLNPYIRMAAVSPTQGLALSNGVSGASFDVEEAR